MPRYQNLLGIFPNFFDFKLHCVALMEHASVNLAPLILLDPVNETYPSELDGRRTTMVMGVIRRCNAADSQLSGKLTPTHGQKECSPL